MFRFEFELRPLAAVPPWGGDRPTLLDVIADTFKHLLGQLRDAENQATAYGCVRELTIDGDRMQVIIASNALAELDLDDAEIRVQLAVDPQSVEILREYLGRILTYGRPDAQPAVLRL
ncbi:hypothetical protein ACIA5D_00045 [Actinoplanes sp. NPDC051513]|uniref:hypothetical protein n=1 Tax=Actinoplanes sp. NPDC051513 TaxID=3363908 RepID=UPI0037879C50